MSKGVYAVFTRHGWGDPEVEWRGPFGAMTIEEGVLKDRTGAPIAREEKEGNGWWFLPGDPDASYRLVITAKRP